MSEPKYRTVFAAKVKTLEPTEDIKLEAKASMKEATASLQNLRLLAADIKPEDDPDILYVVANLAVAGKVNLNDDAVTTTDALAMYKRFEKKFVDIEHNRAHVCGYIVKAGLSEYGTDRVITEDEAKQLPYFNITTVSALWKSVNRPLCNLIVDASDPANPIYRDISLSFEVGFDDYEIGVGPAGDRDLQDVKKLVKQGDEFEALAKRLRANDGSGLTEDGKDIVYRVLGGNMIPLGQGIVTVPAAQVKGIEVITPDVSSADIIAKMADVDKSAEETFKALTDMITSIGKQTLQTAASIDNLTQPVEEKSIKTPISSVSIINANKTMKYNTLEEIEKNWADIVKPEVVAGMSFAGARELFTATILAESKRLGDEAKAAKELADKCALDAKAAVEAQTAAQDLLVKVKAELDTFKVKQAETEAQVKFDERMAAIAEKFTFSDDERVIVVAKIRGLNDDEFKTWSTEADVLYKEKTKAYKSTKDAELKAAIKAGLEKAGVKGSVADKDIDFAEIFASVKIEAPAIHNQLEVSSNSMKDLLVKAFGSVSLVKEKKK